jgi:hypothetical protein
MIFLLLSKWNSLFRLCHKGDRLAVLDLVFKFVKFNPLFIFFSNKILWYILMMTVLDNISSSLVFIKYMETIVWKESLNSDSHEFHQYLQNEQSPLILNELTEH